MSIPKFKRKLSGLDCLDNAFELQKDIIKILVLREIQAMFYNNL